MAESVSARGKAGKPQRPPARETRPSPPASPHLSVRYWKRMRINKVYPVVVSCAGRPGGDPISVRLVVAGAQVVPAEQPMDPGQPGEKVTFYVTPLANGGLRGERVEVLQHGQKIQEIRLPSKVTSQKGTLVWLFLMFFVPWLLWHYFMYAPIGYKPETNNDGTEKYVARPWEDYKIVDLDKLKEAQDKLKEEKNPAKQKETKDLINKLVQKGHPSRVITDRIRDNTPDVGFLGKDIANIYEEVRWFPEKAYLHLFDSHRGFLYPKEKDEGFNQPPAFYLFFLFMFIAFVSFIFRTEGRKTVSGRPLPTGPEEAS
jgi:hypothetical protein